MSKDRYNLKTIYHMIDKNWQQEYERRFFSECSITFPLNISDNKAFMVLTPEIDRLSTSILKKSSQISKLTFLLPELAMIQRNFLMDEINMSNEIEHIYSSRKILKKAWENASSLTSNVKFLGLVKQYGLLLNESNDITLNTCEDIRREYDRLLLDDIRTEDSRNVPDGKIFRAEAVGIYSGTKKIHQGIMPESKLIETIQDGLDFLHNANINPLISIAYFHFLIGYAHPFYDGNGRVNRYLSTVLLSKELDLLSVMQVSYMIRTHREGYYKAFEMAEHPLNKGELTDFVVYFLTMLDLSAKHVYELLLEKKHAYEVLKEFISQNVPKQDQRFFLALAPYTAFSFEGPTKKELAESLNCSENTILNVFKRNSRLIHETKDGRIKRYDLNLNEINPS